MRESKKERERNRARGRESEQERARESEEIKERETESKESQARESECEEQSERETESEESKANERDGQQTQRQRQRERHRDRGRADRRRRRQTGRQRDRTRHTGTSHVISRESCDHDARKCVRVQYGCLAVRTQEERGWLELQRRRALASMRALTSELQGRRNTRFTSSIIRRARRTNIRSGGPKMCRLAFFQLTKTVALPLPGAPPTMTPVPASGDTSSLSLTRRELLYQRNHRSGRICTTEHRGKHPARNRAGIETSL